MERRSVVAGAGLLFSVAALAAAYSAVDVGRRAFSRDAVTVVSGKVSTAAVAAAGSLLTVNVDFGANAYYPLLKTKVGLFQELAIFQSEQVLLNALPKLDELPRTSLRGLATFKPSQPKFNKGDTVSVGGDGAISVHTDPEMVSLLDTARAKKFLPILDIFASPKGLRASDTNADAIKPPTNLATYANAVAQLAGLYARGGYLNWEIFNESNLDKYLDSPTNIEDYWKVYQATAPAIRSAAPDVLISGPAFASEAKSFEHAKFVTDLIAQRQGDPTFPIDYYSFHNYRGVVDNPNDPDDSTQDQLVKVRNAVQNRLNIVPFIITEYENYATSDEPGKALRETIVGAVQLLNHIEWLERNTDIETVSWNRFMTTGDSGNQNKGGFLTYAAQKRAIYNAYKIFGWMPVDRNPVTFSAATPGTKALASSDAHNAGLLVWNNAATARTMRINLSNIPAAIAAGGTISVYRIDALHASIGDGAGEELAVDQTFTVNSASKTLTVDIPATGIVYLKLNDSSGVSLQTRNVLQSARFIRSYSWVPRVVNASGSYVSEGNYGSFDHRSWILRVGTATPTGKGIAGTVFANAPATLWVKYTSKDKNVWQNTDAIGALRVDYWTGAAWTKSVLYPGTVYNAGRIQMLPWGKGGPKGDEVIPTGASIGNGQPFSISLDAKAPAGWAAAGRRVLVTAWTQGLGAGSQSIVTLSDTSGT